MRQALDAAVDKSQLLEPEYLPFEAVLEYDHFSIIFVISRIQVTQLAGGRLPPDDPLPQWS